ncbi:MAG: TetR/AcrR family transcriptional regulator [Solirubrobacteraceae bacterium]
MNLSNANASTQKRRYRMSARADAAAATRERLLDAAWRHFATRPYEDVRLQDVAEDAGVTAQTLHTHFGSKDQLLIAAYWWWGQQQIEQRDTAPVGQVRTAIELLFDHYEAHGVAVLRMLSQEERHPAIHKLTDAGRAYHQAWVERTFRPLLDDLRGAVRERRIAAMVVATDLLVWKLLCHDMGLDRSQAEEIMVEMVESSSQ